MNAVFHSSVSVVHVAAAGLALVAGTYALLGPKGTRRHFYSGRLYVGSMVVVLWTAFHLYFLFGHFGIVHWGAVGSGLALLVGTGAVAGQRAVPGWRQWHYLGMGTSLTGVYATFVVESTYRLFPATYFWWSTLGPGCVVLLTGAWLLWRHWPRPAVSGRPLRVAISKAQARLS